MRGIRANFPHIMLLVLTLLGCAGLWLVCRYDNKYTWPGPDAENGVLTLNAREEEFPLIFLDKGWAFYRDRLLTPEDFAGEAPAPDCWLYLGQYGGFELGDRTKDPRGCGTYRLVIETGETPREWTLELPEIFSAYRLWINGELKKTMGEPAPDKYIPATGLSAVSFRAAGKLELIFAVSNETNYFSGMVYPPAFGSPEAVGGMLAWRLAIHVFGCAAALMTGAFCLALGMRHDRTAVSAVFFLLCICFLGYSGYPVIHLREFATHWAYTLEKLSQYAMLPLLCILTGRFCGGPVWLRAAAFAVGMGACALVVAFPNLPCAWDVTAMRIYSGLLCMSKWADALFLTGTTALAYFRRKRYAGALLPAFSVYGASLLADEAVPLFEPVYTGWPVEFGGLLLVFLIAGVLVADDIRSYREGLVARLQAAMAENELKIQREHAEMLASYIRKNSLLNHEAKRNLNLLRFYFEQGDSEGLGKLLDQLCAERGSAALPAYTPHLLVNSILASKFSSAQERGIRPQAAVDIPSALPVEDTDLCGLLANLLDNAMEACSRLPPGTDKWMRMELRLAGEYLLIKVENPVPAQPAEKAPTWKSDRLAHGYGTQIMERIIQKYEGLRKVEQVDGVYQVSVALCLPPREES